jgi:hypothetical protein
MEGWRAVLTVLVRYGNGQRQRRGMVQRTVSNGVGPDATAADDGMEVDGVESMMEGVKSRGVRQISDFIYLCQPCFIFRAEIY